MRPVMVQKIEQDKLIVTQANTLVEASYTMTLEEKRIVILMVSLIRQDDKDFQVYRIPITDIRDYLGLNTKKLYDDIKRVADTLMSRVLHIPEDGGGWLKVGWVSSARYVPKGKKDADVASLDLSFSPELKPYLLQLKAQFASYALQNVAGLRSFYAIRMYELLNSRRRLRIAEFEIDELKKILKVDGKYKNFTDFRNSVILPAHAELLEKTDLAFDFEETRKGRKVVAVTFHIRDNVPTKPPRSLLRKNTAPILAPQPVNESQSVLFEETAEDREIVERRNAVIAEGMQNGVPEARMRELLATRNPVHVLENVELARKRHITAKDGAGNLAGLTIDAVMKDYAAVDREKRQTATVKTQTRQREKERKEVREHIEATARAARSRDLSTALGALSSSEMEALRGAFVEVVSDGQHGDVIRAAFEAQGWKASGIDALFRIFAAGKLGIASEEAYQQTEAERRGLKLQ